LELGGALGNLVDRIRFGQVTDFIDFKLWPRYNLWPTFNLADAAITIGVLLMAYVFLTMEDAGQERYLPPSRS
jgi:signal peptidase II